MKNVYFYIQKGEFVHTFGKYEIGSGVRFIQNYLFGLKCNKYLVFLIGALMYSLTHLPFQMYVNNNVSLTYIIEALPQLIFTFIFNLIMYFITYKRKDITILTSLHYAIDYLQKVL